MMTKQEHLNSMCIEQNVAALSNVITNCMIENGMTFECLGMAYENVKEVFRKDATIKKAD